MASPPEKHDGDNKHTETFDAAADSETLSTRPKESLKRYALLVFCRGNRLANVDSRC